ncbi:hypothetical protein [Streptomyces scopuliridis]|uniref:hypothetical protein n=1 Tax=Streptomyces scopuliridis TaxID=452529 RepID=UPI00341DEAE5
MPLPPSARPDQTITDTWTRTTEQSRAHFDQAHADTPVEQWTNTEHETWINLHLTA